MNRSKWKGPYVDDKALRTKIMQRNSEILPIFIGMTFQIHNGNTLSSITVTEEMIGHKFGEFIFTRKKFNFKKKKK